MRRERALGVSTLFFGSGALAGVGLAGTTHSCWPLIAASSFAFLAAIQLMNRFAPHPIVHWIHAMTFESFAVLSAICLHPLSYFVSGRRSPSSVKGRPILLVHGYLHDASAWVYHIRQLKKAGLGPIYALNLGHPFRSMDRYAKNVREYAARIEKETGRSDLTLIGHSMGGLVSTLYATRIAPPDTVKQVITIGSPLGGTLVARIGIGPNAREMERNSELTIRLRKEIAQSKIPFYQIGTKTDQLVIPYSSAFVGDHPDRQFLLEDIGHVALLFSSRTANQIKAWLIL